MQTPQTSVDSLDTLLNMPVGRNGCRGGRGGNTQLLGNLVEVTPGRQLAVASRYNISPAVDIYVSVQGTDLANVAGQVQDLVDQMRPKLPRGSQVAMRGQVQTMQASFIGLGVGLVMAIVLGLSADRRQFPVVDRCGDHRRRAAGGARGHRLDPVHHRNDAERAGADRRDHDDGRGHRQQHPGGRVRAAAAGSRHGGDARRSRLARRGFVRC